MPLTANRIIDSHRVFRAGERASKFQRRRLQNRKAVAFICEKQLNIRDALAKSGCKQLTRIGVEILDGSVELHGIVKSYYLKQLAQESVRTVAEGMRIVNQIRVS